MKKKGPDLELTVSVFEEYIHNATHLSWCSDIFLDSDDSSEGRQMPLLDWLVVLPHDICVKKGQERWTQPHDSALLHQLWRINNNCCVSEYLAVHWPATPIPEHFISRVCGNGGIYSSDGSVWKSAACWNYRPSSWADHSTVLLLPRAEVSDSHLETLQHCSCLQI